MNLTETECIHGMDPAWCSLCKAPIVGESKADILIDNGPYQARYDGQCPSCDLPIHEGQLIYRWTDERYRHEGCTP